jgi:hypothetical protein
VGTPLIHRRDDLGVVWIESRFKSLIKSGFRFSTVPYGFSPA